RKMYGAAVSVASMVWESAGAEEHPDPGAAGTMIDGLAQAVTQNRHALMALTALKEYDNYTFTHMVNVSILTMAQARGLGIEGPLLREFGMAALMHDIGKVKTPSEILNKPDKLTDEEFDIMKRHTVDGAEILRSTAPADSCGCAASPRWGTSCGSTPERPPSCCASMRRIRSDPRCGSCLRPTAAGGTPRATSI